MLNTTAYVPKRLYHVTLMRPDALAIFLMPSERWEFIFGLRPLVFSYGMRMHAVCVLPSSIELVFHTSSVPLPKLMKHICHWRVSPLQWEAQQIKSVEAWVQTIREMDLRPVRAGLVDQPAQYPFSSYRCYLGMGSIPGLNIKSVLRLFPAKSFEERRIAYCAFVSGTPYTVRATAQPSPEPELHAQRMGGPPVFRCIDTLPKHLYGYECRLRLCCLRAPSSSCAPPSYIKCPRNKVTQNANP